MMCGAALPILAADEAAVSTADEPVMPSASTLPALSAAAGEMQLVEAGQGVEKLTIALLIAEWVLLQLSDQALVWRMSPV
jgi:hypothetical protein